MKMRKCMALVLSLLMLFGLAACGAETEETEAPVAEVAVSEETAVEEIVEAAEEELMEEEVSESEAAGENNDVLLVNYLDLSHYVDGKHTDEKAGVLEGDVLTITLAGVEVNMGDGGDSYTDLLEKGWTIQERDHDDLQPGQGLTLSGFTYIGDYKVDVIDVTNFGDISAPVEEATVTGVEMFTGTFAELLGNNPAPFEFNGVTEDSSISEIVECFGEPGSFACDEYGSALLSYDYYDSNGRRTDITFQVDAETDEISMISIR